MAESRTVRVVAGHCFGGGRGDAVPGTVLHVPGDLTPAEVERKLALGYVVEVEDEAAPAKKLPAPEVSGDVQHGDPEAEHGDPAPATKPKRKKRPRKS